MTGKSVNAIIDEVGLVSASKIPPLGSYLKQTWQRRDFIIELARARSTAEYSDSMLGRVWQLLTPLLNAAIYFFIFGLLLGTKKGIENYTTFLVAGVFAFNFMQVSVTLAASALPRNQLLTQAIHFPKLVLPLAVVVQQIQQYFVSLAVLIVIVLLTGEPVTLMWLAMPVVLILQILFTIGLGLIFARWGANSRDINQLLPFFTRSWRYVSGVFFSITVFTATFAEWISTVLLLNPGAVYIDLVRDSLMTSQTNEPIIWIMGVFWAFLFFLVGLIYFHRGERKYVN